MKGRDPKTLLQACLSILDFHFHRAFLSDNSVDEPHLSGIRSFTEHFLFGTGNVSFVETRPVH